MWIRVINSKLINIHINPNSMNINSLNLDQQESRVIIDEFIFIHLSRIFNMCLNLCTSNEFLFTKWSIKKNIYNISSSQKS